MYSPNHLVETQRTAPHDEFSELMDRIGQVYFQLSKENANTDPSASTRMYQIGSLAAREYNLTHLIKPEYAQMHRDGECHIHDLDYYFTVNCMTHDLGRILAGFDNGVGFIREPKKIHSACALTAIILQSAQNNMFGGQAVDFFDRALAKYAKLEYDRQLKMVVETLEALRPGDCYAAGEIERLAMDKTEKEVFQAMEALIYNLNTMKARSGNQVPFTSFNFGTDTSDWGRMITRNLLKAFKAGLGNGEAPLFPNLCFRYKKGVNTDPGDPNYDLYRLALEVMSVRMHPTIAFMDSSFNAPYGDEVGYMGCRTRVLANVNGPAKITGRGNLFFTTLNLPRVALELRKERGGNFLLTHLLDRLDERVDLIVGQLLERYDIAKKLRVEDLPFVSQYAEGGAGLKKTDNIEPIIKNGTLSLGFLGLAEMLTVLYGRHHGQSSAVRGTGECIIRHLRDRMDEATEVYGLNFTLLATPAEGLSGRFTAIDKDIFGEIPGVTDKSYYTNSFHLPVGFECAYTDKLEIEGPYHKLTNAGHISYVELDGPPLDNLDGIDEIIRYMAECDIGYAGINFPTDFCPKCFLQNVVIEGDCPNCGCQSNDIRRVRRITGYMSDKSKFNSAKHAELLARVIHIGSKWGKL